MAFSSTTPVTRATDGIFGYFASILLMTIPRVPAIAPVLPNYRQAPNPKYGYRPFQFLMNLRFGDLDEIWHRGLLAITARFHLDSAPSP